MHSLPCDFDELVQWYGEDIRKAGAEDVEKMGFLLLRSGLLVDYQNQPSRNSEGLLNRDPDDLLYKEDLCELLGIPKTTWDGYVFQCLAGTRKRGADLRPVVFQVDWKCSPYGGPFRWEDVQPLYERRHDVFSTLGPSRSRTFDYAHFCEFLRKRVEVILQETLNPIFTHPSSLPSDNSELYRRYQKTVEWAVCKVVRYPDQRADAIQDVWTKLFGTDVLHKYVQLGAVKRLPATLTAIEVVEFLGITWEEWLDAVYVSSTPTPVEGRADEATSRFKNTDVLALDHSGVFPYRSVPRSLPASAVDSKKFESYLYTAATRHAANVLRTRSRRFAKDEPAPANAYLSNKNGSYYMGVRSLSDAKGPWEDSISSSGPEVDFLCDLRRTRQDLGVTDEASFVAALQDLTKVAKTSGFSPDSEEGASFIRLLASGKDKATALRMMRQMGAASPQNRLGIL